MGGLEKSSTGIEERQYVMPTSAIIEMVSNRLGGLAGQVHRILSQPIKHNVIPRPELGSGEKWKVKLLTLDHTRNAATCCRSSRSCTQSSRLVQFNSDAQIQGRSAAERSHDAHSKLDRAGASPVSNTILKGWQLRRHPRYSGIAHRVVDFSVQLPSRGQSRRSPFRHRET